MNLVSVQRDEYGEDIPGTKIQLLYADTLKELCAAIGKFFSCCVKYSFVSFSCKRCVCRYESFFSPLKSTHCEVSRFWVNTGNRFVDLPSPVH
jgi:hypothetical protein